MRNLGRQPSGMPASLTAEIVLFNSPLESLSPSWQTFPPMQDTDVSNRVDAPPSVMSLTFSASSPLRLMM